VNVPSTTTVPIGAEIRGDLGSAVVVVEPNAQIQFRVPVLVRNYCGADAGCNAVTWLMRDSRAREIAGSPNAIALRTTRSGELYAPIDVVAPAVAGEWVLQVYWQPVAGDHAMAASTISTFAFATSDFGHR
jgi:hypothetical protein